MVTEDISAETISKTVDRQPSRMVNLVDDVRRMQTIGSNHSGRGQALGQVHTELDNGEIPTKSKQRGLDNINVDSNQFAGHYITVVNDHDLNDIGCVVLPQLGVIVCQTHRIGLNPEPTALLNHVKNCKKTTTATLEFIESIINRYQILQVSNVKIPVDCDEIEALHEPTSAFHCVFCGYVGQSQSRIKSHIVEEHKGLMGSKPTKSFYKICYSQQLFDCRVRPQSRFRVRWGGPTTSTRNNTSLLELFNSSYVGNSTTAANEFIKLPDERAMDAFLSQVRWLDIISGCSHEQLLRYIAPPHADEKGFSVLGVIQEYFKKMIANLSTMTNVTLRAFRGKDGCVFTIRFR